MHHGIRISSIVGVAFTAIALSFTSTPVSASSSFLGTATGSLSTFSSGCIDPADDGAGSASVSFTTSEETDSTAKGFGSGSDRFGSFDFVWEAIKSGGVLSFTSFDVVADDGTTSALSGGTASRSGDDLDVSLTLIDVIGDTCSTSVTGILVFGSAFLPSGAASIQGTIVDSLTTTTRVSSQILGTRIRAVQRRQVQAFQQVSRSGGMMAGQLSGASAGGGLGTPLGVWASYVRTESENDFSSTAFDSSLNTFFAGVDVAPTDTTVLGIALGFEIEDIDTDFNRGEQDSVGITVAPYFGWSISDNVSLDVSGGVTDVSIDQFRTTAAGVQVGSDADALRAFISANGNVYHRIGAVVLTGTAGLMYAKQSVDSFREDNGGIVAETDATLGQFRFGGEAAYTAGAWEPFVSATYEYDLSREDLNLAAGVPRPSGDDDDILFGIGVRYFRDANLSGALEYSTVIGRDDYDEDRFSLNFRWTF